MRLFPLLSLIGLIIISSCGRKLSPTAVSTGSTADEGVHVSVSPQYAKGFTVEERSDGVRLVEISDPEREEARVYRYALVPQGVNDSVPKDYTIIRTPVRSVICMTTLQLSNFIALRAYDNVAGITSTRHLFDSTMNARVHDGRTAKIGIEGNFDTEVIMGINPDLIFISPFKRGGYDALTNTDIPLVPHLGYKELTPLGQAEWVKFVAMFIGREAEANALFDSIATRYNELKSLTEQATERPRVLSGEIRGGNWYAVGGRSFLAQLFHDAGADYFLDDDNSGGLNLDYETVYSRAADCQYWRIMNSYDGTYTYDALRATDSRYADFRAFKEHGVIYCNMKETPYYETMPMQPERLLEDFVLVFHPELSSPGYRPSYYRLLK